MTEPDTATYEEMKSFLFHELTDKEREALEDRFFADDELFYELTDLENDLVDRFARGELAGEELSRFERSLEKVPERRTKVASASALQKFIEEEKKTAPVAIAEPQPGLWEKIAAYFTFDLSFAQYATAGLIVLLAAGASFLFYERYRLGGELASYREGQQSRINELEKQERLLRDQLKETSAREQDLQKQIGSQTGRTEILNQQLEDEKSKRQRLESDLKELRERQKNLPSPKPRQRQAPRIASILLTPFSGTRGENGSAVKDIRIGNNTSRLTATLQFPLDTAGTSFTVSFRGKVLAQNQKPRITSSGYKFIAVSIASKDLLQTGDNIISATDEDGKKYSFVFRLQ